MCGEVWRERTPQDTELRLVIFAAYMLNIRTALATSNSSHLKLPHG